MRKVIAAAVIAASAFTTACSHEREGGGPTVQRSYQVSDFHEIEVAGPYDVTVRTGGRPGVSASGPEKLIELVVVEVKGDKLLIHSKRNRHWFGTSWSTNGKATFTVTVPKLSGATIAGSGDLNIDKVSGEQFEGMIAGSGALALGAVDVGALKLAIAGSGDAKAASGKAQSAEYEIAGSGGVDARAVPVRDVKVSIAGSGAVHANANATARVEIMGAGDVTVTGGAKCDIHKAGSGNVNCS